MIVGVLLVDFIQIELGVTAPPLEHLLGVINFWDILMELTALDVALNHLEWLDRRLLWNRRVIIRAASVLIEDQWGNVVFIATILLVTL